MSVEAEIKAIMKKKMANEMELVSDTKLTEVGLDSLDMVEIVFEIEDKYKIQLPQNQDEMASATLRDLSNLVEKHIAAQPQVPEAAHQQLA